MDERKRVLAERLEACRKAWDAGNRAAALDALDDCAQLGGPPPPWLVEAARAVFVWAASQRQGPGQYSTAKARAAMDAIHYERWEAVIELRGRRRELLMRWSDDRGMTWEKCYAAVAEMLEGTPAAGTEETIKRSYQYVQGTMRQGKGRRFFQTVHKLG